MENPVGLANDPLFAGPTGFSLPNSPRNRTPVGTFTLPAGLGFLSTLLFGITPAEDAIPASSPGPSTQGPND
jgi:hypothetical protein